MEVIAVHCSWADAKLLSDSSLTHELPSELLSIIRHQSGREYLNALTSALLLPQCTDRVFVLYETITIDLLARASDAIENITDTIRLLCAVARLLPYLPSLKAFAQELLVGDDGCRLGFLSSPTDLRVLSFGSTILQSLLLALFRLLSFDTDPFRDKIAPVLFSLLCRHEDVPVRYLAIRCLAMYMQMTDAATQDLLCSNLSSDQLEGQWESKNIDYRYLSLFEEERWNELTKAIIRTRYDRRAAIKPLAKDIDLATLSTRISLLGEVLLLQQTSSPPSPSSLTPTKTTTRNLTELGRALLDGCPVVLTGIEGSGKTALIREAARAHNKLSSMVTLYLNEQTDAKSLLGLYTTKPQGGSFVWQPGVLTQAVRDGRWVLIENLDRASSEALSILIPIIEQGKLLIPSRRERICVSSEFRILATVRTRPSVPQEVAGSKLSFLGARLWREISVLLPDISDVGEIILQKFPILRSHCDMILRILQRLRGLRTLIKAQSDGLRETLRWCRRMQSRLKRVGVHTSDDTIPGSLFDDFLLDAVDNFAGAMSLRKDRDVAVSVIAEELQCSPQRLNFLMNDRQPEISESPTQIEIGREVVQKIEQKSRSKTRLQPFAKTRHFRSLIESVAGCVHHSEPVLLVGETGIGKTAAVQYLAAITGQELTVINLSQQSESADLIGGFKPVSVRSLVVPLADEFDTLFDDTFSSRRNETFLASIQKSTVKGFWRRLLLLWDEAIRMAEDTINRKLAVQKYSPPQSTEKPTKRRRIDVAKFQALRTRWSQFTEKVKDLRGRLSGGEERFAFSFVEGKLATALRRGHWVLLDEINLATSETLEAITSILNYGADGPPSMLLLEAGHVDQIMGHENFRVFASMNPSTDIGKRELLPALRSRFTELFVESPDGSLRDLVTLIETYAGALLTSDRRAASDLAQLYLDAKRLANENLLSDGAGQKPHFSVRTLVRSLLYVIEQAPIYGLRRSMYEGFSMSFMTVLNIESEQRLFKILDRRILGNYKNARSTLHQTPRPPAERDRFIQFKHYWVAKGDLTPVSQPHYVLTPFVKRNLLNLARAASMRRFPILLQGPTSSGKTSMVEYLANISGNRFVRINNHEHTDLQEYLGTYTSGSDGKLHYQDGVLVDAIRHGKWVVLDELNLAPTDVLEALNRLLDDNRELLIPETQEIVRPHSHFMIFATQNPAGLYGGRKFLSRAFRNRFLELHFDDIPEEELETILRERSQIAPSYCAKIVAVYKKLSLLRQSSKVFEDRHGFATLRDLFRWALRSAENKEELAKNGFMLLAERVRDPIEKYAVKEVIQDVFRVNIDETELYQEYFPKNVMEIAGGSLTWTPAMRRLYVLVSKALENNEPVLLVGETGCGKTQVCQAIAQAHGKALNAINAHSNTEAGDLLGAQRPIRNRSLIEQHLVDDLIMVLALSGRQQHLLDVDLESLLALFKGLTESFLATVSVDLLSRIQNNITRAASLFEWVDGSLTDAMLRGRYFLFDEMSLADDAVLERLNSVLEPSRTLFLAEKGTSDSEVLAARDFQFMATMNPGGDHGKRELSAALRNRLTEVWVPALTEDQDILPVLHERLRTFPGLPKVMMQFGKWFHSCFQGTGGPEMNLRDLLAWAEFINRQPKADLSQSVAQGALLVYIDAIGADPVGSMSITPSQVAEARTKCLKYLGSLLGQDLSCLYDLPQVTAQEHSIQIGPFSIPRIPNRSKTSSFVHEAPTTLGNTMRILRALKLSKPILIEGHPGVGKTAIVTALAGMLGRPLTRINLSEQTDLMDLFGSDVPMEGASVGSFAWQDGPFLKAMQSGSWVLLDEMNLASQSILEGLNSCIDHRQEVYVAELGQTFHRHPDFVLFATQNPHHEGSGRKGLPLSFVNRFTVVYADVLGKTDLEMISRSSFPNARSEYIEQVVQFAMVYNAPLQHKQSTEHRGSLPNLNLRDILRWLSLCQHGNFRLSPRQYLDLVLTQRLRSADHRKTVARLWHTTFQAEDPYHSYFHNLTREHYQVGLGFMRRAVSTESSQRSGFDILLKLLPIQESVILCIELNWPIVLAGKSGCGKSGVIRALASLRGIDLVELSLSRDTDATDLIGGFEQLDYDRLLQDAFSEVMGVIRAEIVKAHSKLMDTEYGQWLRLYQLFVSGKDTKQIINELFSISQRHPEIHLYAQKLQKLAHEAQTSGGVRFQWVDGMLIDALKTGKWVILDNANLCNPSVLDRLNSLLEFDGYLIVSEQHTVDGTERVVKPHPDFRIFLTMDPRHGELSQAMRNRSVELYIDYQYSKPPSLRTPKYFLEANVSRMRLCKQVGETIGESDDRNAVLGAAIDTMAPLDLSNASRLIVSHGDDWGQIESRKQLLAESHDLMSKVVTSIRNSTSYDHNHIEIAAEEQPFRVFVNEPLIQLSTGEVISDVLRHCHWLQDKFVELLKAENALQNSEKAMQSIGNSEMTIFQRSFASLRISKVTRESSPIIAEFLLAILRSMRENLFGLLNSVPSLSDQTVANVDNVLNWFENMVELTAHKSIEETRLRAYIDVGQRAFKRLSQVPLRTGHSLNEAPMFMFQKYSLTSGQGLQRMWPIWRPRTPSDDTQSKAYDAIKRVARCIEGLASASFPGLKQLASWRSALEDASRKILNGELFDWRIIEDLTAIMNTVEGLRSERGRSILSSSTEMLCQYRDVQNFPLEEKAPSFEEDWTIVALAGRPIELLGEYHSTSLIPFALSSIAGFAGWKNELSIPSIIDHSISLRMLQDINSVYLQPISVLQPLNEELESFSHALSLQTASISAGSMIAVRQGTKMLLKAMFDCHADVITIKTSDIGAHFSMDVQPDVPEDHYFLHIAHKYLEPAWRLLVGDHFQFSSRQLSGAALFSTSLAALHLLVPDKPFDPATQAIVEKELYDSRLRKLMRQLKGLGIFEKFFSGQEKNLRCMFLEENIQWMEREPPPPPLPRPHPTELSHIQNEFSNILRSILRKDLETVLLATFEAVKDPGTAYKRRQEYEGLYRNVVAASSRLIRIPPNYRDLTVPVIRMLQCLELGARLIVSSEHAQSEREKAILQLSDSIPLAGASPNTMFRPIPESLHRILREGNHISIHNLTVQVTDYALRRQSKHSISIPTDLFQSSYEEWKDHLESDQALAAQRSRFYHYRGQEDLDQDAEDLHTIFPDFNEAKEQKPVDAHISSYSPKALAIKLATAHNLLVGEKSEVLGLLLSTLTKDMTGLGGIGELEADSLAGDRFLSLVFLELKRTKDYLSGKSKEDSIDVYNTADITQSHRLVQIISLVRGRFDQISEAWPEHATPREVLGCCSDILIVQIDEPIAKVLPRVEKLHVVMSEWQKVASSEFSAAPLLNDITSLIISWRRLEMMSWAKLLEAEDRRARDEALAWWFLLYEIIIAIPQQAIGNSDFEDHVIEMTATLSDFLSCSPVGQFETRLKMLEQFSLLLQTPELKTTQCAISNLLKYHNRSTSHISNFLHDERDRLQRKIKDQIKLASWKDTNVVALRESAKRSHRKLFEIVRKYRTLLGQPINRIPVALGIPKLGQESHSSDYHAQQPQRSQDPSILTMCQSRIANWESRPNRMRDFGGAAESMRQIYRRSGPALNVVQELDNFCTDSTEITSQLRRETPGMLTDDNSQAVKQLKVRKRRYFADTLKALREMGVPSNLNSKELAQQDTTAKVLATTADLVRDNVSLRDADAFYYGYHDIISQIREASKQHSEDLTSSEVVRGCGLSDGLLYILRKQRNALESAFNGMHSLRSIITQIEHLESDWSKGSFHYLEVESASREARLSHALAWLPSLLHLSCSILDIQQSFSNGRLDFSSIIASLANHANAIQGEHDSLNNKRERLYIVVRSAADIECRERAAEKLEMLRQDLESWNVSQPYLRYLLKQLIPWTDLDAYPNTSNSDLGTEIKVNGSTDSSVELFDHKVSIAVDKIFVAVQQLAEAGKHTPSSTKESRWFISSENATVSQLKALHVSEIVFDWQNVLSALPTVHAPYLQPSIALCITALPVLEQYLYILKSVVDRYTAAHCVTCKMSFVLGRMYSQVLSEGFCTPSDSSAKAEGDEGKAEAGTGLGDGEGGQDISKDVGEDEDLSELANQEKAEGEGEEIDAEENAVDMEKEDLKGDFDEHGEAKEEEEDSNTEEADQDDSDGDIDEEAGSVSNLDPAAVDEKLWDGDVKGDEKELENQDAQGNASNEQSDRQQSKPQPNRVNEDTSNDQQGDDAEDQEMEGAEVGSPEDVINEEEVLDHMDPRVQQEKQIDLPEEMQLDGDKGQHEDFDSSDAVDELSDAEDGEDQEDAGPLQDSDPSVVEKELRDPELNDITTDEADRREEDDETAEINKSESQMNDDSAEQQQDMDLINYPYDILQCETGTTGGVLNEQENMDRSSSAPNQNAAAMSQKDKQQDSLASGEANGITSEAEVTGTGRAETGENHKLQEAFKKLGDILERWHRQKREILPSSKEHDSSSADVNMTDVDFEHVRDDGDAGDIQALGASTKDEAKGLDESKAIEDLDIQPAEDRPMLDAIPNHSPLPEASQEDATILDDAHQASSVRDTEQGAFIPNRDQPLNDPEAPSRETIEILPDRDEQTTDVNTINLPPSTTSAQPSLFHLWPYYSSLTHGLSLQLSTRLRLLLPPTTATKLRGDYRTGKRLNMKRIIPFIASGYRRDKIWLRRSLPSKRNYQVVLAVDDSRSMLEGPPATVNGAPAGVAGKALEALALVAKGLSALDIGDNLAIVAFGGSSSSLSSSNPTISATPDDINSPLPAPAPVPAGIRIAHPFGTPFTESTSGPTVFSHFTFRQSGTDVVGLVHHVVSMFRDAKQTMYNPGSGEETWQLAIVVGDGVFDGHEEVGRLVRGAREERVAFVYVVVDHHRMQGSGGGGGGGAGSGFGGVQGQGQGQSILDLQRATFESTTDGDGGAKLVMKPYLETFPFGYYVVVREVGELGGVLCEVLRGWFGEVGGGPS